MKQRYITIMTRENLTNFTRMLGIEYRSAGDGKKWLYSCVKVCRIHVLVTIYKIHLHLQLVQVIITVTSLGETVKQQVVRW